MADSLRTITFTSACVESLYKISQSEDVTFGSGIRLYQQTVKESLMFKVDVEKNGKVTILHCIGRLLRGEPVSTLRKVAVSGTNAQTILLDLSKVDALDAGGVNGLVSLRQWATNQGIIFKLIDPSTFAREMLTRFRLDHVFKISSLYEALVVLGGQECGLLSGSQVA
jgi:anti-anti-sigma regulatory factor